MDISIESKTLHPRWRGFLTSLVHNVSLIVNFTIIMVHEKGLFPDRNQQL